MTTETVIVDSRGRPLTPSPPKAKGNATLLTEGMAGQSVFPYEASNWSTQEMGNWLPWIRSPDAEINQFRDRMVARSRDLVRNDGWAAGGITRILDNTVWSCDLFDSFHVGRPGSAFKSVSDGRQQIHARRR